MPCQESIRNARADFVKAVAEGVNTLMVQCGYSRERATTALIRELSRGDTSRPSDKEVFETMQRHSLGIEEATRAIVVRSALQRAMETASPTKAIELLTSKISVKNLLYDSSDEAQSDEESLTIRSHLHVSPVSSVERQMSIRSKATPTRKAKTAGKASQRLRNFVKPATNGRKRSIEEVSPKAQLESPCFENRPRADSVGEEVSAKIAKHSSSDDSPASENVARTTPTVRTKRGLRAEDSESLSQAGSKRIRGTDL